MEISELMAAENLCPTGERAANLRVLLMANMIGQRISFDNKAQASIEKLWSLLTGARFEINQAPPPERPWQEIKKTMGGFWSRLKRSKKGKGRD